MAEDRLHVVFGTGQVGTALAAHLAGLGLAVRAVSRHQPPALAGVDWRAADATDPEAAADAAKGASFVYQCLNAPYAQWPERFPPLQRAVLAAAERSGALLVSLENLYGYGPVGGRPMTEDLPLAATTVKGRTRAAMTAELLAAANAGRVRVAIGRASDFFGPGVTQGSTLGERVFGNALAGKRADFIGHPDLPHTYSYVPDIAAGLATLGTDARAAGQVWRLPGPATGTTRRSWTWSSPRSAIRSASGRYRRSLCAPWAWSTRCCGNWPRWPTSSTSPSSWTPAIPGRIRGGRRAAGGRRGRDRRLVPDPAGHVMTTKPAAVNALTTPLVIVTPKPAAMNAADLAPAAAWSRRVRRVGGFVQAAFAAFWLGRASLTIGGLAGDVLLAVSAVAVIGVVSYAIRVTAGMAPRPARPEARRIERSVTIATVVELVAAFVLPVVVIAAGHSDWVLPSIVITIGPLLLWLDHLVHVPRYRPVGWALIAGPVILVATMSGSALAVTTGLAAGVVLLGTATASFHDLARAAPTAPGPAGLGAKAR